MTSNPAAQQQDQWGVLMKWLRFRVWMRRRFWSFSYAHEYTPGALENTIYSPAPCKHQHGLLNVHEIIPTDGDAHETRGVLRFLYDNCVRVADIAMLASVLGTVVCAPLTYIWGGGWVEPEFVPGGRALLACDLLLDVAYALHLLLRLNVSFLHPARRTEIVDRGQIMRRWLGSPLYWAQALSTTAHAWIFLGASPFINNIKCVRVAHFLSFPDSLWQLNDKEWIRATRPCFLLVACSHWVACLVAYLGGYRLLLRDGHDAGGNPWEITLYFEGEPISDELALYTMAFVEALYMLTGALDNPLGDGGPRNQNFGALIIVMIFGPIGCVVVALFISAVVREQTMEYALDMRHEENKAFMQRALRILAIPEPLQWRVLSMHYYQKMGHDHEAFNQLFNKKNLSPPLESALLVYLYRDTVCNSKYFRGKDPNYIIAVIRILDNLVFLPGDYVARRGEVANVMYFVSRGQLSVLVPDVSQKTRLSLSRKVGILRQGDHFGEIALVQQSTRTAWVRADSYVLVAALWRDKMEGLWQYFEAERRELTEMVLQTTQADRRRAAQARWRKAGLELSADPQLRARLLALPGPPAAQGGESGAGVGGAARAGRAGSGAGRAGSGAGGSGGTVAAEPLACSALQERLGELLRRQAALEAAVLQALVEFRSATGAWLARKYAPRKQAPSATQMAGPATATEWAAGSAPEQVPEQGELSCKPRGEVKPLKQKKPRRSRPIAAPALQGPGATLGIAAAPAPVTPEAELVAPMPEGRAMPGGDSSAPSGPDGVPTELGRTGPRLRGDGAQRGPCPPLAGANLGLDQGSDK